MKRHSIREESHHKDKAMLPEDEQTIRKVARLGRETGQDNGIGAGSPGLQPVKHHPEVSGVLLQGDQDTINRPERRIREQDT